MHDRELKRYKQRLVDLRERLTGEVSRLMENVLTNSQPPGEHDHGVSEAADKAIALEQSEEQMRRDVAEALDRIERGTYGTCVVCGRPIERLRLDALPYTPYCVHCERQIETAEE